MNSNSDSDLLWIILLIWFCFEINTQSLYHYARGCRSNSTSDAYFRTFSSQADHFFYQINFLIQGLPWMLIIYNFSVLVYEKLCPAPWNVFDFSSSRTVELFQGAFHKLENRMSVRTINIAFLHKRERGAHCNPCKINDLLIVTWLQLQKLVTRKSDEL